MLWPKTTNPNRKGNKMDKKKRCMMDSEEAVAFWERNKMDKFSYMGIYTEVALCARKLKGLLHMAETMGVSAFSEADISELSDAVVALENLDMPASVWGIAEGTLKREKYFG